MAKSMIPKAWQWLWDRASPKVDPQQIEEILEKARHTLPTPVFWLLGKTEQGKTSIVRGAHRPRRRRDRQGLSRLHANRFRVCLPR